MARDDKSRRFNRQGPTVVYCPARTEEGLKWNCGHAVNFFSLRLRAALSLGRTNSLELRRRWQVREGRPSAAIWRRSSKEFVRPSDSAARKRSEKKLFG